MSELAWPLGVSCAAMLRSQPLGFGCAPIGNLHRAVPDEVAVDAVLSAHAAGIRYFDTAPYYGLGLAERRLGHALADRPRESYVVSTKVGRRLVPNPAPVGSDLANGFDVPDELSRVDDYSRDGCRRSLDASLERLGLDGVDIALVHDPEVDLARALAEALPALLALRDEAVVRAVGVGTSDVAAATECVRRHDIDVVMLANRWTLTDRSGAGVLAQCRARNVPVIAAAPFNGGAEVADPTPYLRFPKKNPAVALVLVGMRSATEVRQNLAAVIGSSR